jgi:hypothetical protein
MGERSFVERRRTWNASLRDHFRELEERWNRANAPLAVIHLPAQVDARVGPEDLCRCGLSAEILKTIQTNRPNLLLIGPPSPLTPLLRILESGAAPPVMSCSARRLALAERPIGTLVIHDANRLSQDQQRQLHGWLARHPPKQVIVTAPEPLLPLVMRNAFNPALFFELNVKSVVMDEAAVEGV